MAQIEAKYESIFILDPTLGEETTQELVNKFKSLAEANATLVNVDEWGKRRMAYPINDHPEGYYTLMTFTSKPDFPAELNRIYKITDGVMRYLVIAVE
ncbi:MAG: 30S ribosomal protein S6 [Oscillospiraceae bacterium]|nr:30S ribosomal protein S6 [Oscillospiraceae bacterium]